MALYEFKCSCRYIFFGIFIILALVGLVFYLFVPTGVNSINDLFYFSMDWISQVFPSSMVYKTAYYFNIVQLLFVVGFVANDARMTRLKTMEALHVHPLNNSEIVIGNFLGKLLVFTLVNLVIFLVAILINFSFFPSLFFLVALSFLLVNVDTSDLGVFPWSFLPRVSYRTSPGNKYIDFAILLGNCNLPRDRVVERLA